jgi:hypothetical protein
MKQSRRKSDSPRVGQRSGQPAEQPMTAHNSAISIDYYHGQEQRTFLIWIGVGPFLVEKGLQSYQFWVETGAGKIRGLQSMILDRISTGSLSMERDPPHWGSLEEGSQLRGYRSLEQNSRLFFCRFFPAICAPDRHVDLIGMRRRTGLDAKLIKGICKYKNGVLLSDGLVTFGTLGITSDWTLQARETFPVWGVHRLL